MNKWNPDAMRRLYQLHQQHVDRLRQSTAAANRSLGSSDPEKAKLEHLTPAEFEAVLTDPASDPEMVQLWVRRIISGHEHEFPRLQAAG